MAKDISKSHVKDAQKQHLAALFGEEATPATTQAADDQQRQRASSLNQAAQSKKAALSDEERQKLAALDRANQVTKKAVQRSPQPAPTPPPTDDRKVKELHDLSERSDLVSAAVKNMRTHAKRPTPKPSPAAPSPPRQSPARRAPARPPSPDELERLLKEMAARAGRGPEHGETAPTVEAPPVDIEESPEKNREKQAEIIEKLRAKETQAKEQAPPLPQADQERAIEAPVEKAEVTIHKHDNAVDSAALHSAVEKLRAEMRVKNPRGQVHGVNATWEKMPNHPMSKQLNGQPPRTADLEAGKSLFGLLSGDDKKIVKKLERVLLEIRIPRHRAKNGEPLPDTEEQIAVAEQLFASLHSIYRGGLTSKIFDQDSISFEIAAYNGEIGWFMGVPLHLQSLVEKQIHAYYPDAEITPVPLYNIFAKQGYVATSSLALQKNSLYPVKTYKEFEADSMAGLAGALSKISSEEGAAIQIMIAPTGHRWRTKGQALARNYAQGKGGATSGVGGKIFGGLFKFGSDLAGAAMADTKNQQVPGASSDEPRKLTQAQEEFVEKIENKASKVGFNVVIRVVTAAEDKSLAEANLQNICRSFGQFGTPDLNGFKEVVGPVRSQAKLVTNYIFRDLEGAGRKIILNAEELATLWHAPTKDVETPNVRWLGAKAAPTPSNMPREGLLLGYNQYRGQTSEIRIKEDDRRRHLYAVGKTGMGKSVFLQNMILQDIRAGRGVAVIDPHGDLAEYVLKKIPRERAEDVIYFDPGDLERPMAFNMLDYATPEQKDHVVQETVAIFYKLFGEEMIGPKFEHWTRNGILTLMEDEETGAVLFDLPRLFSEREFAAHKIAKVKDPVVRSFWQREMAQTSDFHKSEMLGYFISKFGRFITNEMMRNIIGQPKSAFDIRQVMDEGKILIMNLSRGKTGEINSALLGMIAVSKIHMAAMSRVDIPEEERRDFYLYVDEFQNLTNEESIQSILSEARKYRLNLAVAHQYIAQLEEPVRDAVFGNVGTAVSFRVGADDAEYLEKQFEPVFDAHDLINVAKANAYAKLIIDGLATRPFNMKTYSPEPVSAEEAEIGEAIRQLSRLKYGRDRKLVDHEIRLRSRL